MFVQCESVKKTVKQCLTVKDTTGSTWSVINGLCSDKVMFKTLPGTRFKKKVDNIRSSCTHLIRSIKTG